VDGVRNGCYRSWNADGVCLREGSYRNGLRDGALITRKSDGTVLDASEFNEGTGTYRIFNASGQLTDEFPLRDGKLHGAATTWRGGKVAAIRHYVDGQCVAANCGR
jgi:antitoxin component YwqK of YwqJK toxin-antitoxin module